MTSKILGKGNGGASAFTEKNTNKYNFSFRLHYQELYYFLVVQRMHTVQM